MAKKDKAKKEMVTNKDVAEVKDENEVQGAESHLDKMAKAMAAMETDKEVPAAPVIETPAEQVQKTGMTRGVLWTMMTSKSSTRQNYLRNLITSSPKDFIEKTVMNSDQNEFLDNVYKTATDEVKEARDEMMRLLAYIILEDQEKIDGIVNKQ